MKVAVMLALLSMSLATLPSLSSLNEFRTYWVPDDKTCLAEFEIKNLAAAPDKGSATTDHLLFAYVELFHGEDESNPERGDRSISCTLLNGEVMHRGCNIYDDFRGENANVMEGDWYDSWTDATLNDYYIIQTTGGGKYWDGYSSDAQNDNFNACVIDWSEDGFNFDNCEYETFANVKLNCDNDGDDSRLLSSAVLTASVLSMF